MAKHREEFVLGAASVLSTRALVVETLVRLRPVEGEGDLTDDVLRCSVTLEGVESGPAREAVFQAAVRDGWVLRELGAQALSLEDVFAQLTTVDQASQPSAEEAAAAPAATPSRDAGSAPEEGAPPGNEESPS